MGKFCNGKQIKINTPIVFQMNVTTSLKGEKGDAVQVIYNYSILL